MFFFVFHFVYLFVCQTSWETVGKKRNLGKEGGSSEIKEINDKKGGDRDTSRGRGGSSRRGRGISRGREGKTKNKKNILKVKNYFCNFKYFTMLIASFFFLFIVNNVQELIDFIVILCLYYLQVA